MLLFLYLCSKEFTISSTLSNSTFFIQAKMSRIQNILSGRSYNFVRTCVILITQTRPIASLCKLHTGIIVSTSHLLRKSLLFILKVYSKNYNQCLVYIFSEKSFCFILLEKS
jgi:hypothetical protein